MLILSNGSGFKKDYLKQRPSYILPYLEYISYIYKSFSNINAFPLAFDSKYIKNKFDLINLLKSLEKSTKVIELI